MSDARKKLSSQAFTADDRKFLEAIKRTQEETALPPGMNVDVGAIAAKAFASYLEGLPPLPPKGKPGEQPALAEQARTVSWASLNVPKSELTTVLSTTTVSLSEAVAELIEEQPESSVQFRREFLYTVVPTAVLIFFGIGYVLFKSRIDLPYSLMTWILTVVTAVAAITLFVKFRVLPEQTSRYLRSLRYSSGSLVGGLAVAVLGLLSINYGVREKWKLQRNLTNTKLESTSRDLAEVGFATVGAKEDENLAEKTRMNFVGLDNSASVELKSDKPASKVEVKAKPDNVATSVFLLIEPFKADVYTTNSTEPDYQIVTGKVNSVSDNYIEIEPNGSSATQQLRITLARASFDQATMTTLRDKEIKVLYIPKSSQAIKMALLGQGSESIIYNVASAKLQNQSAAMVP